MKVSQEDNGIVKRDRASAWIQSIREHSWELELLASGIALIIFLQAPVHVLRFFETIQARVSPSASDSSISAIIEMATPLLAFSALATRIMTVGLGIHIVLRAYWIGIVGLSSVYPAGVRFEKLEYAGRYLGYLRRSLPHPDALVHRLDKICSSIFALSFLVILSLFSFLVYGLAGLALVLIVAYPLGQVEHPALDVLFWVYLAWVGGAGLLYLFDVFTFGKLKAIRNRWFSAIFFQAWRFVRWASLAALYDSIYYIFISNLRRRVVLISVGGVVALIAVFATLRTHTDQVLFPRTGAGAARYVISEESYESLRTDKDDRLRSPIIQSEIISGPYIQLFIPYDPDDTEDILALGGDLRARFGDAGPELVAFSSGESDPVGTQAGYAGLEGADRDSLMAGVLDCFAGFNVITLNGAPVEDLQFAFYRHPDIGQAGVLTVIPTALTRRGYNVLSIRQRREYEGLEDSLDAVSHIPFWYAE
jgi:hypothetical protein